MKLLHLDASALGSHSVSRGLTAAIVSELTRSQPGTDVTYHDLVAHPLSHWTPVSDASDPAAVLGAQMMDEFLAADVVVIGAPMYNFSIPSQLKAWIDRITVAGKSFRYGPNGPEGLAGGKRVIVASTRGGIYSEGSAAVSMDFQETYLRALFGFLGVTDLEFVRAEGVAISDDNKAESVKSAHASIGVVARKAA
jgi:FMN-dependent NADH-azoreductase